MARAVAGGLRPPRFRRRRTPLFRCFVETREALDQSDALWFPALIAGGDRIDPRSNFPRIGLPKRLATVLSVVQQVVAMTTDLELVFRLRLVVARVGEGDLARWWNSRGQLGAMGSSVLRRGFPRTHHFAQARSVFAVAARRCADLYSPPGSVTLWRLPADIEDDFNQAWPIWIDRANDWSSFFSELERCGADLAHELERLGLVTGPDLERIGYLKRSAEQRAVAIPGQFTGTRDDLTMLALGFAKGEPGNPAVPFQSWTSSP
jgi:hypothetical protein